VAPGLSRVGNHSGDFRVTELIAESSHGGSRMTVENGEYLVFHGGQYVGFIAIQCREGTFYTLAIRLVAGDTIVSINLFTLRDQFFGIPFLVGIFVSAGNLILLVGSPVFVLFLADHLDHNAHEGVVTTAEFGTLAPE